MYVESESVELKRVLNDTFEKEVVAFLNTHFGTIYIGVNDDGTVEGVENLDLTMKDIAEVITHAILPNPQELIDVSGKMEEGKLIVKVDVKKGNSLYYIKKYGRSSKGCYIRIGTSCRSMTEDQIEREFQRSLKSNTRIVDIACNKQTLSFRLLKMLYSENGLSINENTFEQNVMLRTRNNEYNIQAHLLADENDYSIKTVKFDGDSKASNIVSRNEYGYKCLIVAMLNAMNYCNEVLNQTKTVFFNGIRRDIKLFDKDVFREAWFNACLHNDWVDGTPPAIYIFNDRLEIISTGGLPYNMSKEDFFSSVSRPVNDVLARIFIQLGLIEQTGHGVSLVVKNCGKEAFEFLDNFIRVTIPFEYEANSIGQVRHRTLEELSEKTLKELSEKTLKELDEEIIIESEKTTQETGKTTQETGKTTQETEKTTQETEKTTQETEKTTQENIETKESTIKKKNLTDRIFVILKDNNNITRKELSKLVGLSDAGVKYHINILKDKGLIEHIGPTKGGYWRVIE